MRIQNVTLKIQFLVPNCLCKQGTKNVLNSYCVGKSVLWFKALEKYALSFSFPLQEIVICFPDDVCSYSKIVR